MLKYAVKYSFAFALFSLLFLTACNKEDALNEVDSDDLVEQALVSVVAEASAGADGCFELIFPVTLELSDGTSAELASVDEARAFIQEWKENNPGDRDNRPQLVFPVELLSADGEIVLVNTQEELRALKAECGDRPKRRKRKGNRECSCFQMVFPITLQFPDGTTATIDDRADLKTTVREWKANNPDATERPELVFPITVELEDGTTVTVEDREALQELKQSCRDSE